MSLTLVSWVCVFSLLRMQGLKQKKYVRTKTHLCYKLSVLQVQIGCGSNIVLPDSHFTLFCWSAGFWRERDKAFHQNEALHKGQPHMHLIGLKTQPRVLLSYFIGTESNASVSQQVGIRAGVLERLYDKLPHLLNYSAETWSKSNPRRSKPFNKLLGLIQQPKCQAYLKCIAN